MNKKEIAEIRRRFQPERSNITRIRGCYVNAKREVLSTFDQGWVSLPQGEAEKYTVLFRRTLSGEPGKNLVDIVFDTEQVGSSEEHALLMALKDSGLSDEDAVQTFFSRVIDSLEVEDNYLILLMHDAYDVPGRTRDGHSLEDASDTIFSYVLCSICPVKLCKPALQYYAEENRFHSRDLDWIVAAPELGFLFPCFDDRSANIYNALYYTRDAAGNHPEFISSVFHTDPPMAATQQRETFQALLQDALGEECRLDVVQAVNEQLCERIAEQKGDKEAEPALVSKREIRAVLEDCGVQEERISAFEEKYDQDFGEEAGINAVNIAETQRFEVRTPNVVIRVDPEHSDLLQTRVINGLKYILIRADEGVEVNGVNVHFSDECPF